MEEEKKLIFALEFDTEESMKRAATFRDALEKDKAALSELNKEIKVQGAATAAQRLEQEKLEKSIRESTRARTDEIRAADKYIQATKNGNSSIKAMRGELSFLKEKYLDLNKAERENLQIGGKLQKEIKALNDQLVKEEKLLGDNRRSVGAYTEGILEAAKGMGGFKKTIDTVGTAVKANPIGLLVTALTLLPKLFESSGDSAGLFTGVMEQGTAVLNVFLDRAKFIGEAVSKLLKGDFSGAAEAAKKSYQGIGDELQREIKLTGDLAKAKYQLERDEARNIATSKRLLNEVERLKNVRDNEFISIQARNEANEKAFKIEMERQATLEKLARRRLAIIQKEVEMRGGANKASTEMLRELGEAEEALYDILEDSAGKQNELITNRYQLNQEALQKEKELKEERLKNFEAHRKQVQDELTLFQKFVDDLKTGREKQLQEERKFIDDYKKVIDKQFQNSEKARQAEIAAEEEAANEKVRLSKLAIAQKEKELEGIYGIAQASQNLFTLLAEDNAEFAEFEKGIALFKIGLSSAEALTKGIASAQGIPFPGNLIAMGTNIAVITENLLQAKQLIKGDAPKAPKSKFADGGILEGPSHAAGGISIPGTGIEVEGGEAVINKRSTALFAPILSALNQLGGGKPLAPARYMAAGGLVTNAPSNAALSGIDYDLLASKMVKAIEKMPPPIVRPTEFMDHYNHTQNRKVRTSLGN